VVNVLGATVLIDLIILMLKFDVATSAFTPNRRFLIEQTRKCHVVLMQFSLTHFHPAGDLQGISE
jgi:hypothetical protein